MANPSSLMGVGFSALAANTVCGDTVTGLTAAGSTNADALQLSSINNRVTTTALNTGVRLPPLEVGAMVTVMNSGANALLVYPGTGNQINALTATTGGFSVAAGGRALFIAYAPTVWGAVLSA